MRADLGRLINFIERDRVEPEEVMRYAQRLRDAADGDAVVDRHPARGPRPRLPRHRRARRAVRARARARRARAGDRSARTPNGARIAGGLQGRTRPRLARLPRGRGVRLTRRAVPPPRAARPLRRLAAGRAGGPVLRRVRPRHARATGPGVADPRARHAKAQAAAPVSPADEPLLNALKAWRTRASDGKPAYTVAHNSTLELDRRAEAGDARRAGDDQAESGRRSSSATASRC